jgi:hypothetical protein
VIGIDQEVYVRADASLWTLLLRYDGESVPPGVRKDLPRHWVEMPASNFVFIGALLEDAGLRVREEEKANWSKAGASTIDGKAVVGVETSKLSLDGGTFLGNTVWVAAIGTPYPVKVFIENPERAETFSDWNNAGPAHGSEWSDLPIAAIGHIRTRTFDSASAPATD